MPTVSDSPPRATASVLAAYGLLVGAGAVALSLLARGMPNLFFEDDAYFYLQIAWNIGTGAGSSFDGLHVTNGYHLLWMGLLAPLAFVVSAAGIGKTGFLLVVCGLSLSIAGATVLTTFRAPGERLLALFIFLFCGITMETTLLGSLLVVLLRVHLGEVRPRPWLVLLASMLVPLARIDFVWMAPAFAFVARREGRGPGHSGLPLAPVLVGSLAGAGLHLLCELALFGVWTSVSSAIEASAVTRRGPLRFLSDNLSNRGNQIRYAVGACLAAVVLTDAWRRRDRRAVLTLAVVFAPVLGYLAIAYLRDWYFLTGLLLGLLLASRAATRLLHPRVWTAASVSLSGVMVVAMAGYLALAAPDFRATARFITDANGALEPGAIVYGVDGTGFPGWWLDVPVINGDGLVNSVDYARRMQRQDLGTYLAENRVTHIITNRPLQPGVVLSWRGLRVKPSEVAMVAGMAPSRNRLVNYRLYRLLSR